MREMRFALLGAGFWAGYQLAAWGEQPGARCVAVADRDRSKAEALARRFGVPSVYHDAGELLRRESVDFVDIVAAPEAHEPLALLAASRGVAAICQKPLATGLDAARRMAAAFAAKGLPLLVHENWRWQAPLRALKAVLDAGTIGRVFRADVRFANSFPVFDNQPALKELDPFILVDIGTHVLDAARFLFGEAESLFCRTARVRPDIRGEDVATALLSVGGIAVSCTMSYASRVEHDRFPETFVLAEGELGSVELAPDFWVRTTTADGTVARRYPPPRHAWADPAYDLAQSSMVPCQANLLAALRGDATAETTAEDNLRTLALVFAALESARSGQSVTIR